MGERVSQFVKKKVEYICRFALFEEAFDVFKIALKAFVKFDGELLRRHGSATRRECLAKFD